MRLVEQLGFVAIGGLVLVALGCGGAASYDVAACAEQPEAVSEEGSSLLRCKAGSGLRSMRLTFGLEQGTKAIFATEIGSIRCRGGRGKATLDQREGTLEGKVTELQLERCDETIPFCSALNELQIGVPIEPAEVRYTGEGPPQGRLVLRRPGTYVSFACSLVGEVECIYGKSDSLVGAITNPPAQKLRFDASLSIWRGDESCPETTTVRMTTDVRAEDLVLDDGTRLEQGKVWIAKTK